MAKPVIPASSILDALPSELSRGLFAQGRLLSLDADQTLFLAGDEGDGCYRVEEGLLKASVAAPNGGERILAILGPGSMVGELSMIDGAPRQPGPEKPLRFRKTPWPGARRDGPRAFAETHPALAGPAIWPLRATPRSCQLLLFCLNRQVGVGWVDADAIFTELGLSAGLRDRIGAGGVIEMGSRA